VRAVKMRGTDYQSGWHDFTITAGQGGNLSLLKERKENSFSSG
jgi:hypothetical protein